LFVEKRALDMANEKILTITPPATIYSFHPSLLPTTLGTYLSRSMIDSLMMALAGGVMVRILLSKGPQ
jgi:hypothetical protein